MRRVMSALDSVRTAASAASRSGARLVRSRRRSLRTALQNAAITIPQLLRQRAAMHGDGSRCARRNTASGIAIPGAITTRRARAVALGLLSLGLQARRPRRDRGREHAGMVLRRSRRPDDRRGRGRHLSDQSLGRAAIHRPPLRRARRHHRRPGADRQGARRAWPTMAACPALEAVVCIDMKGLRHYAPAQLMSFDALCELGKAYALRQSATPNAESRPADRRRRRPTTSASWSTRRAPPARRRARC